MIDKYFIDFPKLAVMLVIAALIAIISSLGLFSNIQAIGLDLNQSLSAPFIAIVNKVDSVWNLLTNLQQVQLENIQLKAQVAKLDQDVSTMADLQSQNQYLLNQLSLNVPPPSGDLLAKVVRYEYLPAPGFLFINIGNNSVVKPGNMVARYNYIVGQVTEVDGNYAKVRLISATGTDLAVKVGDKGVVGRLIGSAGLDFKIIGVDQAADVSTGDAVRLLDPTGEDRQGYLIGTISAITGLDSDATKTLEISSPIQLNALDYLVVLPNHD